MKNLKPKGGNSFCSAIFLALGKALKPKLFAMLLALNFCFTAFAQTPVRKFETHVQSGCHGLTQSQIDTIISRVSFENFRMQNQRDTLVFDNGFTVVLPSATELQQAGLISSAASYQTVRPPFYKAPIFHINQAGQISAAYEVVNTK